jgi:hypothetical protein
VDVGQQQVLGVDLLRERPPGPEFDAMLVARENLGVLLATGQAAGLVGPEGINLDALAGLRWAGNPLPPAMSGPAATRSAWAGPTRRPLRRNMREQARKFGIMPRSGPHPVSGGKQLIKTAKPGRDGTVRVTFTLPAERPGGAVSVVGDFNGWDPFAHPLRRRSNGTRSAAVTVRAGSTLHFRYLAEDGVWFDDETVTAPDGCGATITV